MDGGKEGEREKERKKSATWNLIDDIGTTMQIFFEPKNPGKSQEEQI